MQELEIVHSENVQAWDTFTINTEHRLDFSENRTLTAVYPSDADTKEYTVAVFPVKSGTVELPDGSAVLEASDSVIALVPSDAYGEE